VHTTRSDVPEGPSSPEQPREPGSYTVSVVNGVGAAFSRPTNGFGGLTPVETIEMPELHDTFIQNDELTGRTPMYVAGGFDTGFYVYDVTTPSKPKLLAEWDLTPEYELTGGHVIAADMVGGVYSLKVDEDAPAPGGTPDNGGGGAAGGGTPGSGAAAGAGTGAGGATGGGGAPAKGSGPAPAGCTDTARPATRFTNARLTRRGIALRGTSSDAGCSGLRRVQVAIGRTVGRKRCRFVQTDGKLSTARPCSRPVYLTAVGTSTWSFQRRIKLARRSHLVFARATDRAGNRERFALRVNGRRVKVR